jgi:TrkA domain protein
MKVKTSELPGIGKKYAIDTAEGNHVVVILHHHGLRELYNFGDPDDDEPNFTLQLNDEEAKQIGAIFLGVDYQPVAEEKMELLLKSIRLDWLKVQPESCLVNMSIGDARIRTRTGSTVIGIQRGEKIIGSPGIDEVILPGDILMVIGSREETRSLDSLCHL